jgi:hypothetical protein
MASKRGYTTTDEVNEDLGITVTDAQINKAEEIIDDFIGAQDKFMSYEIRGLVAAGGASSFTLEDEQQNNMQKNFLRGCWVEIIGGSGEGQRKKITGQTYEGVVTIEGSFSPALDTTSYYRIWQLGKFPRKQDVSYDSEHVPNQYYKSIPEKVRKATVAQIEYMVNLGDNFFGSDKVDMVAEHIADYSYDKGSNNQQSATGIARLIAPKAKILLSGLKNRLGEII